MHQSLCINYLKLLEKYSKICIITPILYVVTLRLGEVKQMAQFPADNKRWIQDSKQVLSYFKGHASP